MLSSRWIGGFLLAVLLALACVGLGSWQWDRREQIRAHNAPVLANYDTDPRPVAEVPGATSDERLPTALQWTPVVLRGSYLPQDTVLVRNRTLEGRPGYHVLVPLALDDGRTLLVDRGWLPTGATGAGPDSVPAPPPGEVEVVARLRPPEPDLGRDAPPGQVQTIDLPHIAGMMPGQDLVTGVYGVRAAESPAADPSPVALPRPIVDEGPHLSYSLQWFVFALGVFVGYGVIARRTAHDLRAAESGAPLPQRPSRRRRPSAEDEEDAELDAAEQAATREAQAREAQAHRRSPA